MIDSHKIDYSKLDSLNVSRETFLELDEFKEMILDENKKINLISQHTEELARERHIICLLYTSPSPRDATLSRMPSSA